MNVAASYGVALLFALLVHGLAIALMSINWHDTTTSYSNIKPYYIEAAIVAENPYTARDKRAVDREKNSREQKIQNRRTTETNLRLEQIAWERRQKEQKNEPKPAPVEPDPALKPVKVEQQGLDPEKARSAFEQELVLALVRESDARKAITDDEKAMVYVAQIQHEIIQNWSRPPSARNGMELLLRVRLIPTGEVIDVKLEESSGNDAFDRSAIQAVRKAHRFVVPSDALRFERDFRVFTVLFRPDDLRL